MATRVYNSEQLAFQAKNNVIWSEVFGEYQEIEIGESQLMKLSEIAEKGYSLVDEQELGEEYGIDIDKDVKREWAIAAIAWQFGKNEDELFDNIEIWGDIKDIMIWCKDTSYVMVWCYKLLPIVTPIIFEG